jgi:hypothetical protein
MFLFKIQLILANFLKKNSNFSSKNSPKLQKIVIRTSTPDLFRTNDFLVQRPFDAMIQAGLFSTTWPSTRVSELPDALFSYQKSQFGSILEGLGMENVGMFVTIWNILRPFGIICGSLVYFVVIWYIFHVLVCLDQEKSGNPDVCYQTTVC